MTTRHLCAISLTLGLLSAAGCDGSGSDEAPPPEASSGTYALLYRDDFDTLDASRWQLMTHSWGSNLAVFSPDTAKVESGVLTISLLSAPAGTTDPEGVAKSFLGAEVRSRQALTYGRVKARAKFARGSAVISSLVTIYTPWPADNWNELDVECLGKAPEGVQYNAQVYTGPPTTPPVTTAVSPTPSLFQDALRSIPALTSTNTRSNGSDGRALSGGRRAPAHVDTEHPAHDAAAECPAHYLGFIERRLGRSGCGGHPPERLLSTTGSSSTNTKHHDPFGRLARVRAGGVVVTDAGSSRPPRSSARTWT